MLGNVSTRSAKRTRPNVRDRGFRRAFVATAWLAALALTASPCPAATSQTDATAEPSDPAAATSETTPARANVVLVGTTRDDEELVALLRELLGRQEVECEFSNAARFDPDELFADGSTDTGVRVFVRLADRNRVRLYFRGPGGERFLLRSITLPSSTDEVRRELVGQVVESSVVALLRSSTGLSREQASAEVAREERTSETPPPPRPREPAPPPDRRRGRSLELVAGVRYAIATVGPDFGLAHGPGLEIGVGTRGALRLRGRVCAERYFEQALDAEELSADVRTSAFRGGVDVGFGFAHGHLVSLGVGGGIDVVRVVPGSPRVAGVTLSGARTNVAPVVRPELRYELGSETIVLGAALFADVALVRTHYDLVENGAPERLATPWVARPGGAVLLGIRW